MISRNSTVSGTVVPFADFSSGITLMLARTRALSDLQRACVPAYRAMLEGAIADLDRRIKALG